MSLPGCCTVPGCTKLNKSRGFCSAHYERQRRHGDPLRGGVVGTSPAEPSRYFAETVLPLKSDDCLEWPYARSGVGYGQMRVDGRSVNVHRLVCLKAHGDPPTREHQAAHSCGNRLCCNHRHLSWKTQAENELDKVAHGTMPTVKNGRWVSAKFI